MSLNPNLYILCRQVLSPKMTTNSSGLLHSMLCHSSRLEAELVLTRTWTPGGWWMMMLDAFWWIMWTFSVILTLKSFLRCQQQRWKTGEHKSKICIVSEQHFQKAFCCVFLGPWLWPPWQFKLGLGMWVVSHVCSWPTLWWKASVQQRVFFLFGFRTIDLGVARFEMMIKSWRTPWVVSIWICMPLFALGVFQFASSKAMNDWHL